MTFLLYLLSTHPPVLQRLRAEILDVIGPVAAPNLEDVRQMRFLRAVINGTLPFLNLSQRFLSTLTIPQKRYAFIHLC